MESCELFNAEFSLLDCNIFLFTFYFLQKRKYHKGCFTLVLLACTAAAKSFEDKTEDKIKLLKFQEEAVSKKHNIR